MGTCEGGSNRREDEVGMSGATFHLREKDGEVHDVLGVEHRIVVGSEHTEGGAAVIDIRIPPGTGSAPHTDQREALVWYVIEGVLDFETERGLLELEVGDAVFMERNSRHSFANAGDRPARALMVALPGGIEGFFREAASVLPTATPGAPPPPKTLEAFAQVAGRYGIELHEASNPA